LESRPFGFRGIQFLIARHVLPLMGQTMFLKVKSDSDDITTFLTFGTDFSVSSIADLVTRVGKVCEPRTLQELVFYAHGVNGSFSIGTDMLGGISTPKDEEARLGRLTPLWRYFGGSVGRARLVLCICEAGKNTENLMAIAKAIGQPVFACTGEVRPTLGIGYGWWRGDIIMADPLTQTTGTVSAIPDPPVLLS
jgi:hypothetical protein